MSKLEQIEAFIAIVEENSFVSAAKKLNMSPAAITRQMKKLEFVLKAELLKRSTRKIQLTELGSRYYLHCKKMLSEFSEAESLISGHHHEPRGLLKVTSSRYFGIQYLLPKLSEFMSLYPKLQVECELAERFPDFSEENVDVLFGVSLEGPEHLTRKRVAMTKYVLCAAPSYLKKNGTPKFPEDLKKHAYITHIMRDPNNVIPFKNHKEIIVNPILRLNDSFAMRECAINAIGIARLHDYAVDQALKEGKLVEILKTFQTPSQPVYLYYQKSQYLPPKIRCFIDFYVP